MYIVEKNGTFEYSHRNADSIARILSPILIENGESVTIPRIGEDCYESQNDRVVYEVEKIEKGLFRIKRTWTNLTAKTRRIRTVLQIQPCFKVNKFLIPCVSINGNPFGSGFEPKGYARDGKPWVFSYDRVSIPACTLTENSDFALSLFASANDPISLAGSCSVWKDEPTGLYYQELHHPVSESPVAYTMRDDYTEAYEGTIELTAGGSFVIEAYLLVSRPRWKNYGIADTLDAALSLFPDIEPKDRPTDKQVWDWSIAFAESLVREYKGMKGFHIGLIPDGKGGFRYRPDDCYELAWCGQNVLLSRMLIEDYIRNGDRKRLDTALEILDARVEKCISSCGLIAKQLFCFEEMDEYASDTCNLGYGAYEYLRVYQKLCGIGIEKSAYLSAGLGVCDFFVRNYSEKYGFGKEWLHNGICVNVGGTIGAFLIPALAKAYELTGKQCYLETAEKAMEFYCKRDLNEFCCTAGALDTCCVDKETSAPLIMSGVMLYSLTKNENYLEYAQKAAYYFTSWMFHYQPIYEENTEIAEHGVCVRGLTAVSAQHHHLDMYAGIVVPYLHQLAEMTEDQRWRERADLMWKAVLQCIGDGERKIHGVVRPKGSQNEAIFHCPWTFWGAEDIYTRGMLNDWLVAWPCAFRLSVLEQEGLGIETP